jgi:predicted nucleotidyltransferase
MERAQVVNQIRETMHRRFPATQVILYGSEARGDARPDSDFDLLILVDTDRLTYSEKDAIKAPLYDIELETGADISTMILPRSEWENRPFATPFQTNVQREGITL